MTMSMPNHRPNLLLALWLPLFAGCPTSSSETQTQGTSASNTDGTTDPMAGTSGAGPTSTSVAPPSTATTMPGATCPDGNVDESEACDDGNAINGDGCNNDCTESAALLWEYRSSANGSNEVRSVAVDADGSIVVGGQTTGLTRWIARFDSELVPQWSQQYGVESHGQVQGVAVSAGALYAAGALFTDADGHDIWVARLSPDGAIEWEDSVSSGVGDDYLTQAVIRDDGDLIVAGIASGEGGAELWTRRYAADGAVQWTATYPTGAKSTTYSIGPGLSVTPDAVVVGSSLHKGDTYSEFLVAYPPGGGDPLWTRELPSTHGTILAIAGHADGDLALAGVGEFAELMVRRMTTSGGLAWSSNGCTGKIARDMAIDGQGDIVVIGDGPSGQGSNVRLCKFAPDGTLRWGKDINGGAGGDRGYTVAIDASDRIIAGGEMLSEQFVEDAWLAIFAP